MNNVGSLWMLGRPVAGERGGEGGGGVLRWGRTGFTFYTPEVTNHTP